MFLSAHPNLDARWALYQLEHEPHDRWAEMAAYVDQVRQGRVPDQLTPSRSIQGVYAAILDETLGEPRDQERWYALTERLLQRVDDGLRAGSNLLTHDFVAGDLELAPFIERLEKDEALYREDRARGQRFRATIPAEHAGGTERTVGLLVLENPQSAHLKVWARADPDAPEGHGWPLLLVFHADGDVLLTADPARKLTVGWLAEVLTAAEQAKTGDSQPWYDGARHQHSLAAAPRGGSALKPEEVVRTLRKPLRLRSLRPARWPLLAGALGIAAVASLVTWFLLPPAPTDEVVHEPPTVLSAEQAAQVLADPASGPTGIRKYAVVAGACEYAPPKRLRLTCDDARAMRDLLVEHYGYQPEHVLLLVDDDPAFVDPTAENLRNAFEQVRQQMTHDQVDEGLERFSFLFYYSGHGGVEETDRVSGAPGTASSIPPATTSRRRRSSGLIWRARASPESPVGSRSAGTWRTC